MGRRKPDTTSAVADFSSLEPKPPKVKEPSPLEVVVEQSFDPIIKAVVEKGYSLTDVCQMLRKRGIRPSPKMLKLAMIAYAEKHDRLADLPKPFHLIPRSETEEGNTSTDSTTIADTDTAKADEVGDAAAPVAEKGNSDEGVSEEFVEMPKSF